MEAQTEVKAKLDIKETMEFLEGLKVVVPAGVEIAADGKLSAKDVKPVVEAIKKYEVVVDAVKGVDLVIPEAKDLDQAELAQIGLKALEVFKEAREAYARGK